MVLLELQPVASRLELANHTVQSVIAGSTEYEHNHRKDVLIMMKAKHKVSTVTLLRVLQCWPLFFYNARRKRVTHRTNNLHAGALLVAPITGKGEGQRLNSSRPTKIANLSRLIKKLLDDFCSVVEISRFGAEYAVMM